MKVLITGATGFIGSHLTEALLNENFDVYCIVRNPLKLRFLQGLNVKIIQGDCSQKETIEKIRWDFDYIFNLSGITKATHPEEFFQSNYLGTKNLVEVVAERNPSLKRFVHVSSLAAVGPCRDGKPVDEKTEPAPISEYGKSKLMGEKAVEFFKDKLPITIIRPPAVYGPRDSDFLTFFKMIKVGVVLYLTEAIYSMIYVNDLVNGIITASKSEKAVGETFFIAESQPYDTHQIVEAISDAVGKRPVKIKIPKGIGMFFIRVFQKFDKKSIINSDKLKELVQPCWVCDTQKAEQLLGFKTKTKLKEGMEWTAKWYRMNQWI
ncbi:NAD-dependent epimerase/dehydratase family protein [Thermodesulfovibrio yellowstonii]|uniref:NAD-dependent epimerase/dehydratase family protein/3-beta hydroxysteroid dehydrogenase/isomerase family protein n=1 Tax=Thermodesulfovibrio yellowstonii (strain ATCC 51303 / DSM 11347 / YP87) TaxID=289376 RepID=B5YJM1_THEYD|nr:NAD(P)-dependent oxidoreductase [Thermodesulfovibrio yellowstonii]ACI21116.1 NAD-dependent epimerase/dehydratase family protein/3-beta hydroxysteroid dehydrogenase/isomerase family protein [Thermodesulfovibrio yellowstonii DSM 11347]